MEIMDNVMEEKEGLQRELIRLARKSKLKRKLIIAALIFVLIAVLLIAACLFGRSRGKAFAEKEIKELNAEIVKLQDEITLLKETPMVVDPVTPQIVLDVLSQQQGDISELASVEYLFTNAGTFTDSKQIKDWNIPFTEKGFTMKWDGVIKAGVKLDQLAVEVQEEKKLLVISVPAAEILSYEVDQDSIDVLDEKNNIFNKISVNDKINFDESTRAEMEERAIQNGLLEKAQKNAEDILTRLINTNPNIQNNYTLKFVVIGK